MRDREAWLRLGGAFVRHLRAVHAGLDRFCARMNDGLAAIAVVLAIVVLVTAVIRVPEILAQRLEPMGEPPPITEISPVG